MLIGDWASWGNFGEQLKICDVDIRGSLTLALQEPIRHEFLFFQTQSWNQNFVKSLTGYGVTFSHSSRRLPSPCKRHCSSTTFFNFCCIDGCGSFNWSRFLKFEKNLDENPDSPSKFENRPRVKVGKCDIGHLWYFQKRGKKLSTCLVSVTTRNTSIKTGFSWRAW